MRTIPVQRQQDDRLHYRVENQLIDLSFKAFYTEMITGHAPNVNALCPRTGAAMGTRFATRLALNYDAAQHEVKGSAIVKHPILAGAEASKQGVFHTCTTTGTTDSKAIAAKIAVQFHVRCNVKRSRPGLRFGADGQDSPRHQAAVAISCRFDLRTAPVSS